MQSAFVKLPKDQREKKIEKYSETAELEGKHMLAEFTVTEKAKGRAKTNCKKDKACELYVDSMGVGEEYVTLEGIHTLRKMFKVNPEPSPSCDLLLMAYITGSKQNGYKGFCDELKSDW